MSTTELLDKICEISAIKEMRVTVKMTTQCAVFAAGSTFVGGLVAGPIGILLGNKYVLFLCRLVQNYSRGDSYMMFYT